MRVPIRKPGKYTHLKTDPNITEDKYIRLKNELKNLKEIKRPPAIREVKRLALLGDFSENAAYQIAKGKLRGINGRILKIEDRLIRAEIIKKPKGNKFVQLGHFVTIEKSGQEKTYQILGSSETKPGSGTISHLSPLGKSLMGKSIGDIAEIKLPEKSVKYKIIKIE
ncbi:GreA/GreB family elongation factor [bacterium]|nr:GreA/GreB family elongation factor [bacterium]